MNVAARLQEAALPGEVVIGPATCEAIRHKAVLRPLGPVRVRGKEDPVEASVLERLDEQSEGSSGGEASISLRYRISGTPPGNR